MDLSEYKKLYDNDPKPYLYISCHFDYKNKAQMILDVEIDKARAAYEKELAKLPPGPFDAIAPPRILGLCGGIRPMSITDENRPELISYCNLALDQYNDQNEGADFVFSDLVKSTRNSGCSIHMYYITFQAKPKVCSNSDSPAITFQAKVQGRLCDGGPPEVRSCAIKPT